MRHIMSIPVQTSAVMLLQIGGALVLGWAIGYERHFNGRASGTQVYCLVCMASCAVTLLAGYPSLWYSGTSNITVADPTRVVGNILTGIGFLGAGIIVQSGTTVRGLTTAASVWSSSAVGMMVGVGFYAVAIGLTILFLISMVLIGQMDHLLPARTAIAVTVRYQNSHVVDGHAVTQYLTDRGLQMPINSLSIHYDDDGIALNFVVLARSNAYSQVVARVTQELSAMPYVKTFDIAQSSRA